MAVSEFDSMFARLAACKERRESNGGECDNPAECEIGWCSECRQSLASRTRGAVIRSRAESQDAASQSDFDKDLRVRARKPRGRRRP